MKRRDCDKGITDEIARRKELEGGAIYFSREFVFFTSTKIKAY
jgi:hypothetical protein